ncbi:MAG: anti-sigma factor antagonist [Deltaproteobacteria bacterium HGW-Deltaproteobacteria-18]|jgi:anti-sigma B factor antagonist|nr:MAG: anti-sigma factor antagonist [Deltaproteobacteria bacterium HGW-Deltaproteobacteria-18]
MNIETRIVETKALLTCTGRMDAVSAPRFEAACMELLAQGHASLVVDLGGLEYISSAGLRSILSSVKKLKASGGGLAFCGLSCMVDEVFRVSGFLKLFRIHASAAEALEG